MSGRALPPISRRTFLHRGALLTIAAAGSVLIGGSVAGLLGFGRAASPGARLAAALAHGDGAARIGRAALASDLVERDVRGLMAGLVEAIPDLADLLRDGSDDDIRAALDAARRRDFVTRGSGLLRVGGWVVARTEARACALVALA
jgi:hypothetical protein